MVGKLIPGEAPETTVVPARYGQKLWTLTVVKSESLILRGVLRALLPVINKT